ncbi:MAG: tetratricopeptide repeat protein [Rhodocyclaceae bacterium]|nr:tetratricopeptide repeat protein [Rhodocyclaceae bacterium]MBX3667587.1 tetratricopeptide repeat protein [Rhodocyclaceae bacterium]
MKKTLTALVFVCASTLAFALPTPQDIRTAVEAGNYAQAETQLREVLREKPASAKAHYELGQVLARSGRRIEARAELLEAQRLDPSLKFASNPQHFRELLGKLSSETAPAARSAGVAQSAGSSDNSGPLMAPRAAAAERQSAGFPWGMVAAGGGVLLVLWIIMRAMAARRSASPAGNGSFGGGNFGSGGFGNAPAAGGGSGMGGAVLGGLAGLAAGYGLAKVLGHSDEAHAAGTNSGAGSYVPPLDAPASDDYGAFDAGSGDAWDAGGGSDDNW